MSDLEHEPRNSVRSTVKMVMEKGMGEDELLAAFEHAPDHPLWKAYHQVLDEMVLEWADASRDPRLTHKETDHYLGRQEGLLMLKAKLQTFGEMAREGGRGQGSEGRGQGF